MKVGDQSLIPFTPKTFPLTKTKIYLYNQYKEHDDFRSTNSPILSQTELNQKARPTAETVKYQRGVGAEIPHACEE